MSGEPLVARRCRRVAAALPPRCRRMNGEPLVAPRYRPVAAAGAGVLRVAGGGWERKKNIPPPEE